MNGIALLAVLIVLYSAVAVRLDRWSISMPMVMVAVGFALGPGGLGLLHLNLKTEGLKTITELTLALLLFADASTLNLRRIEHDVQLPVRLLGIGLPLTMVAGTAAGYALYSGEGLAFAAMMGAILAPTDAALGLPIFTNRAVPNRIRRALNVESGLNDGIATPFVALFVASAVSAGEAGHPAWIQHALSEVVIGLTVGIVLGIVGSWVLTQSTTRGWTSGGSEQIAILALAAASYFVSVGFGGNGFIAAFTGGIVFGAVSRNRFSQPSEFTETFSTFLCLLVWTIFGAALVYQAITETNNWHPIAYAILSLTVVRMLPVALSVLGLGLRADTVSIMGWFGPRGLASVVFTLFAIINFQEGGEYYGNLLAIATWTILLSVVAHGISAGPLATFYGRRLKTAPEVAVELNQMPELRARRTQPWTTSPPPEH